MEPKRIRHACSRCRRQKLRCDYERPCPLCVRAGADCTEATQRTWRTNRPKSAAYQARQRELEGQRNSKNQAQARHGTLATQDANANNSGLRSPSCSSTSHIAPEDVIPSGQRASALHLVGTIFQKYHVFGSNHNHKVDAIPASESPENGSDPTQSEMVPVVDLIGIPFPSPDVVTALLGSYKDSVHWYIRVLHEPSLRERLVPILESGLAPRSQRPLLLLALMMMILGARFVSDEACEKINRERSLADLTSNMVVACERWFLPSMDCVTVDTVIYAYLLAAHYLCNRQTRAAFLTLGTTVRAAQSIGLNREAQWGEVSDIERETRRCAWWSVFIGAGFISMSWGTPPMLSEADCQVRHPTDVEDACNLEQCPGFGSLEKREDGEIRPVTVGSYNRYKAEMYKIAITIMRRVYFTKYRNPEELTQLISKLHQRLLALEKSIPPELRVENHAHNAWQGDPSMLLRKIFAVQALTLQVSYDNMQIFLFRPLISMGGIPRSLAGTRENSPGLTNQTNLGNVPSLLLNIAQNQCWTSAIRTSMVGQNSDIMKLSQFTFPAVHVGVHTFSAGVMLGLLALTNPLSAHGQESKRAIAKIIQVPKVARLKTHVWGQMTQILTDLMHVIATEETKALIAGVVGVDSTENLAEPEVFGQPLNPYEDLETDFRTENSADGVSAIATDGSDFDEHATLRMNLPTGAVESNTCELAQASHSSGPFMTGVEGQQAQYSSQFDAFDAPNLWLPQQPADPLQMMDQLWMWDGSFSYQ